MTTLSLAEAQEKLEALRYKVHNIMVEAGTELDFSKVRTIDGSYAEKIAEFQRLQAEMTDTGADVDRMKALKAQMHANEVEFQRANQPVNAPPWGHVEPETWFNRPDNLRKMIEDDPSFKTLRDRKSGTAKIELPIPELKTLVQVSTMAPQATRTGVISAAVEERTVIDMVGTSQTDGNSLDYYEETTVITQAAVTAEAAEKPEGAAAWTLRTVPIVKVAVWIPVTKEALDDVPFLESQIRGRLAFSVERTEEAQVLTGSGAAGPPQLIRGLNNATGIQTQAKGADPTPDAIFRAMQKVRGASGSGFAEPDGVVLHPNDWTDIKLLRATDGTYLWGSPATEAGDRIWGLPVRQTTAQTENTGLVGAFSAGAEVYRREGITITASSEHASYFIENKIALLAESRLGLAIWRPTAFCTVTGI